MNAPPTCWDPWVRACAGCGREITKCDGGVKAGDYLEWLEGKRRGEEIRELCGLCVLVKQWTPEGELIAALPDYL